MHRRTKYQCMQKGRKRVGESLKTRKNVCAFYFSVVYENMRWWYGTLKKEEKMEKEKENRKNVMNDDMNNNVMI